MPKLLHWMQDNVPNLRLDLLRGWGVSFGERWIVYGSRY